MSLHDAVELVEAATIQCLSRAVTFRGRPGDFVASYDFFLKHT